MTSIEDLRKVAEAATPGPWAWQSDKDGKGCPEAYIFAKDFELARTWRDTTRHDHRQEDNDAEYIATFHPARIKLLLDAVEAAVDARETAAAAMRILVQLDKEIQDDFFDECRLAGVKNGWGKKLDTALKALEDAK